MSDTNGKSQMANGQELTVTSKLVPKPRKSEIIEALVQREWSRQMETYLAAAKRRTELVDARIKSVLEACAAELPDAWKQAQWAQTTQQGWVEVRLTFRNPQACSAAAQTLPSYVNRPCLDIIRKQIRATFTEATRRTPRVGELLADPDTCAALDSMLAQLKQKALKAPGAIEEKRA